MKVYRGMEQAESLIV